MKIDHLDHLVLTIRNLDATCAFYEAALGMTVTTFGAGRRALSFGSQKINLHMVGHEIDLKAAHPMPGSADLCFITLDPLEDVVAHLSHLNIPVIEGPIQRTGATGPIQSVYIHDPDMNLIEIANILPPSE